MIGATFTDPSDALTYRVVAADGPYWVVECVDEFRSMERLTTANLAARFNVVEPERPERPAAAPDEDAGWRALSALNDLAALRLARGDFGPAAPTPEQALSADDDDGPRLTRRVGLTEAEAQRLGHRR
jgi:hypothetical protein